MKSIEELILELQDRLTGDLEHDSDIMEQFLKANMSHPDIEELADICTAMLIEMAPEEFAGILDEEAQEWVEELSHILYSLDHENYPLALQRMEHLINEMETSELYVSEYARHALYFDSNFQDCLYHFRSNDMESSNTLLPYTEFYRTYAQLLMRKGQYEQARVALRKGMQWNPVCFDSYEMIVRSYIQENQLDTAWSMMPTLMELAYLPLQLMRVYRHYAYLYMHKQAYKEAYVCLCCAAEYSLGDESVDMDFEELYTYFDPREEMTDAEMSAFYENFTQNELSDEGSDEIFALAKNMGLKFYEEGRMLDAQEFLTIASELRMDEEVDRIVYAQEESPEETSYEA